MNKPTMIRHLRHQYHLLRYRKMGITLELIEDELENDPDICFNDLFNELGESVIFTAHNARFELISDLCYALSIPLDELDDPETNWYRAQADELNAAIGKIINALPRR